jgi:hypothetical protein
MMESSTSLTTSYARSPLFESARQEAARSSEPNCMQSVVKLFREDRNPLICKIAVVAAPLIAFVGIGLLTGLVVPLTIAATILTAGLGIWAGIEWNNLVTYEKEQTALGKAGLAKERASAFQAMQEAVGGSAAFNRLPILDIGARTGDTGYLDFLRPSDLSQSIMRGSDKLGRPFIALKLRSNRPEDYGREFVVTFFQRYTDDAGRWTWGTTHQRTDLFGSVIRDQDRAAIRQIVVSCNHPQFTLI